MNKYRKKPVVIEAMQFTKDTTYGEILNFLGKHGNWDVDTNGNFYIKTLEGDMITNYGDYIIKGIKGEFYPCKPDIFEATYEIVEESKEIW